jgi:hypothetical protein
MPAAQASIDPSQCDVLQECRTVPLVTPRLMQRKQYVSDSLTSGLPGLLSARGQAKASGGRMPVDDVPPISARLAAYGGIISRENGNGVRQ